MRAALTPQAATELRTRRAELNTHIEAVAREAREAQVTLAQKNRTLANFDVLFKRRGGNVDGSVHAGR